MLFVAVCWDRAGIGEIRERAHPEHLRYMADHASFVKGGGPLEDANGFTIGTLFILDFPSETATRDFLSEEPFHTAGCFEASIIRRYRQIQPAMKAGTGGILMQEAQLELSQSGEE